MIRAVTAILSIFSLALYQYFLVIKNIDISESYFIVTSLCIVVFCLASMKKKDSIFVSSISVLCSAFFAGVVIIYFLRWVLMGDGSTNYYTAIIFSALLTLIYLICYAVKYSFNKHR